VTGKVIRLDVLVFGERFGPLGRGAGSCRGDEVSAVSTVRFPVGLHVVAAGLRTALYNGPVGLEVDDPYVLAWVEGAERAYTMSLVEVFGILFQARRALLGALGEVRPSWS